MAGGEVDILSGWKLPDYVIHHGRAQTTFCWPPADPGALGALQFAGPACQISEDYSKYGDKVHIEFIVHLP